MSLVARAKNENIKDLSDKEIIRVFKGTAHEIKNIEEFKMLVLNGLSLDDIYRFNEEMV
jgi:hypothetical protein